VPRAHSPKRPTPCLDSVRAPATQHERCFSDGPPSGSPSTEPGQLQAPRLRRVRGYRALPQLRVAVKQGVTQGKEEMVA
jgi:hypothetical protein